MCCRPQSHSWGISRASAGAEGHSLSAGREFIFCSNTWLLASINARKLMFSSCEIEFVTCPKCRGEEALWLQVRWAPSPPDPMPDFPRGLIGQWLLPRASATPSRTPRWLSCHCASSHSVSCPKVVTCLTPSPSSFLSSVLGLFLLVLLPHSQHSKEGFQEPVVSPVASPGRSESAVDKKIVDRVSLLQKEELAPCVCASSPARWGTCWDSASA